MRVETQRPWLVGMMLFENVAPVKRRAKGGGSEVVVSNSVVRNFKWGVTVDLRNVLKRNMI